MNKSFLEKVRLLNAKDWCPSFKGIKRGLEKESLRVNKNGQLSKTAHPLALGSSLMHPMITTDFSEAQLEFITPPTDDLQEPLKCLAEVQQFTHSVLEDEMLWAGSMPCPLPSELEIPIANYGSANVGKIKEIYRRGLGYRYGRMMQTISGIHYNFSLPMAFWQHYQSAQNSTVLLTDFVSEQYLGLVRNALRYGWLLPLFFGASPAVSNSFFKNKNPNLIKWGNDSWIGLDATSLRLSDVGYQNSVQKEVKISFNTLPDFLNSLSKAIRTPFPPYSKIGLKVAGEYRQLSDAIFQIENEYYSLIRPKRITGSEERMLSAMQRQGIEYIEVRGIDLNPFDPVGIDPQMIYLVDVFLLFCLLMDSPALGDKEIQYTRHNMESVVLKGRQEDLTLLDFSGKAKGLKDLALEVLESLEIAASLLDKSYGLSHFSKACIMAKGYLKEPEHLLSSRVLQEMRDKNESYFEFGLRWSKKHQEYFQALPLPATLVKSYNEMSRVSLEAQKILENSQLESLDAYLQRYLAI